MVKMKIFFKNILYVVRLEPTISALTAIRSIQRAKRDSDGYRIRKNNNITLKSILFIMFANPKLVLRSYTSLYGIFMSANLTLFSYTIMCVCVLLLLLFFCLCFVSCCQTPNDLKIKLDCLSEKQMRSRHKFYHHQLRPF